MSQPGGQFLALLDADPTQAARKYETLRAKLLFYFRHNGALDPDNLADEVILRVIRRLGDGIETYSGVSAYCFGVAEYVLREERRRPKSQELPDDGADAPAPPPTRLTRTEQSILVEQFLSTLSQEERNLLEHPLVGGVILFTRNFHDSDQLVALVAAIHAVRTPPLVVGVDHEGGRVQRFRQGAFSRLPAARRIGQEYDLDARAGLALARRVGWLMAAELRAHGIDLSFAPCVDLDYGVSEVIGDRAFHARADVVAQLAVAYMHGMRDAGMAATAKHFPGHGAVRADSHVALPVDRRELADLADDLTPYRRLIDNALPAVMVAHVQFSAIDERPASSSNRLIRGVLRGELRFQGAVFADDLSMGGAAATGDILERARRTLAAGCDMLPVCNDRSAVVRLLDRFAAEPDPVSQVRLVRMRGRDGMPWAELSASAPWREAQQLLAQCAAAPQLTLGSGAA